MNHYDILQQKVSRVCRLMHHQSWQYSAPGESQFPTVESSFWLWEGHPKSAVEPVVEAVQDASAWALKSGKLQQTPGMRYANNSTPGHSEDQHQQQQFADYWSRQDDKMLSPYMPGYQLKEERPHSSPALSTELATGHQEGMLRHSSLLSRVLVTLQWNVQVVLNDKCIYPQSLLASVDCLCYVSFQRKFMQLQMLLSFIVIWHFQRSLRTIICSWRAWICRPQHCQGEL